MRADPSPLAIAPASEAAAAQKLEAGQRLALAAESEVSVPPPSPAIPEGDTAAQMSKEEEPEAHQAPQKVDEAAQVPVRVRISGWG